MPPIFCPDPPALWGGGGAARRHRGFTLVEVILVVAITGVLVAVVAVFIKAPVEAYASVVRRGELAGHADIAARRLTLEVRTALPNSLRVSVKDGVEYLEFIPTYAGARYRDVTDGGSGDHLSFTEVADVQFDLLGAASDLSRIRVGDHWVVYNLGPQAGGSDAADAYRPCAAGIPQCNRSVVQSVAAQGVSGVALGLQFNPFALQSPPQPSPGSRGHLIDHQQAAVTFSCPSLLQPVPTAAALTRHWGYGFEATQPQPPAAGLSAAVLDEGVLCSFGYSAAVSGRTGLLTVTLRLSHDGESVTLVTQTLVDNTP